MVADVTRRRSYLTIFFYEMLRLFLTFHHYSNAVRTAVVDRTRPSPPRENIPIHVLIPGICDYVTLHAKGIVWIK